MSIYISGMKMPKDCAECWTKFPGLCSALRKHDCPLIPVPEHGDLIERDKLREVMFIGEQCLYSWDEIEDAIDYAPTIIPASEEEDK